MAAKYYAVSEEPGQGDAWRSVAISEPHKANEPIIVSGPMTVAGVAVVDSETDELLAFSRIVAGSNTVREGDTATITMNVGLTFRELMRA